MSFDGLFVLSNYASPSSGDAYSDRQLTTNFEFGVEIFCMPSAAEMFTPEDSQIVPVCLPVCLSVPREKK